MKAKDIRNMNVDELENKIKELKIEEAKAKIISSKSGSSKLKNIRKITARILTIIKEKNTKKEEKK